MDEFAARTEANFREVRKEIREARTELGAEIKGVETGLRAEMNERFTGIERHFTGIEQRFNILFGALATGFVAAVVQHFLG